jgi:hypothetical protein
MLGMMEVEQSESNLMLQVKDQQKSLKGLVSYLYDQVYRTQEEGNMAELASQYERRKLE